VHDYVAIYDSFTLTTCLLIQKGVPEIRRHVHHHVPPTRTLAIFFSFQMPKNNMHMICRCACQWSCDNSYHSNCIISCPTCFSVVLAYAYRTKSGSLEISTQSKDFEQNKDKAGTFLNGHQLNAMSPCRYNPNDLSQARSTSSLASNSLLTLVTQITFDVSYTGWKWAITSIFGIIPLAVVLLVCLVLFIRYRRNRPSRRQVLHMEPLPASAVQRKNDGRVGA